MKTIDEIREEVNKQYGELPMDVSLTNALDEIVYFRFFREFSEECNNLISDRLMTEREKK